MFKRLSVIVAAVFFLLTAFINSALSGTFDAAKAIKDAKTNYGYSDVSKSGAPINYVTGTGLSSITDGNGTSYGFLAYGEAHGDQKDGQYRYIGYTYYGEDYTNMDFPADQNAEGADFASQNWIIEPWKDPVVQANNENLKKFDPDGLPGDGDPAYHTAILAGIMAYGGTNANNGYTVSESSNPAFWNEIERFVHILSPATSRAWGIGRMWRYDENGGLWYVTVPIMPGGLLPEPGNLKAVSIDLGVPPGHLAEPGIKYQARVAFKNESARAFTEAPVAVLHGEYQAALHDENGQLLPKKVVNGKEVQVADFQPGESRTFRCDWHPWPRATDGLTGIVNRDEIGKAYQETTYEDNMVSKEVPVDFQNLRVEIINRPSEVIEGDTATVAARVFNESGQMVVTKVVWKVDGNAVKEVNDFDVVSQGETAVSFTMPKHNVTVEVDVNPDQNAPPNETSYDDNRAACSIVAIPKKIQASGDLSIGAPDYAALKQITTTDQNGNNVVNNMPRPWTFTVTVTTNIPEPPPPAPDSDSPPPPPPVVVVKVNGQSNQSTGGFHYEYGLYGEPINNNIISITPNWSKTYTADWGRCVKTFTFEFPWSGIYGSDITANISATADCDNYGVHLSASKSVTIAAMETPQIGVRLTE